MSFGTFLKTLQVNIRGAINQFSGSFLGGGASTIWIVLVCRWSKYTSCRYSKQKRYGVLNSCKYNSKQKRYGVLNSWEQIVYLDGLPDDAAADALEHIDRNGLNRLVSRFV